MNYRAYADNVILRFVPRPTTALGGLIHLPQQVTESRVGTREAEVVGVGPGHWTRAGKWVPTEVQVGQLVLVDALAGQNYDLDLTVPRHNKPAEWGDERGEFRVVREDEILGVVERGAAAAAE
jgi:co-chaperonin GroES (HSP10)